MVSGNVTFHLSRRQLLSFQTLNLIRPCCKILFRVEQQNPAMTYCDFRSFAQLLHIWLCCVFQFLHRSRVYCNHTLCRALQTKFRSVYSCCSRMMMKFVQISAKMGMFSLGMCNLQYNIYCISFLPLNRLQLQGYSIYCLLTSVLKHFIMYVPLCFY